ncbi:hypothetical protein SAMN05444166_3206 [Singulisphaera sp. GP187]|nr:hypothetical protein SAMN05444166_3206 [Singulisphaera sp. GP187]
MSICFAAMSTNAPEALSGHSTHPVVPQKL